MAIMHLLPRLGTAPLAYNYLVTPTARLSWQSVSCSLHKFHSYSKHHVLHVEEVKSLRHFETTHVCRSRCHQLINSSWGQKERRALTTQADRQVSSTYKWKLRHPQMGLLAQQLVPVRHYAHTIIYPIPENLDPWEFPAEELGTTFTSYLSDEDVEIVRTNTESELEMFNTVFKSNPKENLKKNPIRDDKVFGAPLEDLTEKDIEFKKNSPLLKIPSLLSLMLKFIHKEGLNSEDLFNSKIPSSTKVKKLKEDIEANFYKNQNYEIPSSEYNANVVAVVLKDFLAELPTPLISTPEHDFFLDLFENDIMLKHRLEGINLYILTMSPEHRESLQMLLALLRALTKNKRLTVQECADMFAPILFAVHPDYSEQEKTKKKKEFVDITRILVHYNDFLFTVPADTLKLVRNLHYFGPKPDPNWIPNLNITLKSPESESVAKTMDISPTTTAEEVVAFATEDKVPMESYMKKLEREVLGKRSETSNFLYEVGGNIDERVLDPKTKILSVYRMNMVAEFSIKTWQGYDNEMSVKSEGEINVSKPRKKP
ncbi:unnamed protein product [Lymnaea stagnalis]|uniref:Rho-GAP domain-containing protein n=1 Tax=Lymnaea stagnalis TaxID=6523 RepID=A0AAV2IG95_LYMST